MQTITITIDNGVRVVDATTTELTRTVGMVWSISIVDTAGAAITHASVERWELIVAQDFHAATAVLASGTIYNPETGALVIAINGNTAQMATLLDGKRALAGKAMLVGYDADQIRVVAYVWDCTLRNVTSDDSTPPSDAAEDLWATRAWVDAIVNSVPTSDLTQLTGTSTSVAPWNSYEWSLTGACTLSIGAGWSATGDENCKLMITKNADATLDFVGFEADGVDAFEDGDGIYECWVKCYNGKYYFFVGLYLGVSA